MAAVAMAGSAADAHMMEAKKVEYFSSINSMARKIMQEREKIKETHGSAWEKMTPNEQDVAIDNAMMDPQIRARYAMHRVDREEVVCYPKLLIQTGQKIVHFGEEDITWQDEHSAPFSWETKSQLDFSLISGGPEQQGIIALSDPKPSKPLQASQGPKGAPGNKTPANGVEGVGRRGEEESSFWKISAERSRLEGEKAEFQSLTPSQIKSLEKGEKPLPSYLRPDLTPEEPPRPAKQRVSKPPAPPPPVPVSAAPPAAISGTPGPPAPVRVSSSVAGWERSQSTLPSVSTPDEMFSPGLASRGGSAAGGSAKEEKAEALPAASPTFTQFNTSNNILKTGFDFLDNW